MEYKNLIHVAFPNMTLFLIGHEQHLLLVEIVTQARQLSYDIQHGFVHRFLFMTTGLDLELVNNNYRMYAFGLKQIRGTNCRNLIKPMLITKEQFKSLLL